MEDDDLFFGIGPGDLTTIITASIDKRTMREAEWGFVPEGTVEFGNGKRFLNARSELIEISPAWKYPLRNRRCLVIADGFSQWAGPRGRKAQYHMRLKTGEPFAMAGVFSVWPNPPQEGVERRVTCAVITVPANELIWSPQVTGNRIQERMPAILRQEDEATWLDRYAAIPHLLGCLRTLTPDLMEVIRIQRNKNDAPDTSLPFD